MRVKHDIVDSTGRVCGHLETTLCDSEQTLNECIKFNWKTDGIAQYRDQIPLAEIWPVAVINDIEVDTREQERGLGTTALQKFLAEARQHGARIAFLRVGWHGDDPVAARTRMVAWYVGRGFKELKNTATHVATYMYCLL